MQLATTITTMPPSMGGLPFDVISPRQLFNAATKRIERSIAYVADLGAGRMPTMNSTTRAIFEAQNGARLLSSVIVPSTPFTTVQQALQSLDHIHAAVALLRHYRSEFAPDNSSFNPNIDPTGSGRDTLVAARGRLVAAASRLT